MVLPQDKNADEVVEELESNDKIKKARTVNDHTVRFVLEPESVRFYFPSFANWYVDTLDYMEDEWIQFLLVYEV